MLTEFGAMGNETYALANLRSMDDVSDALFQSWSYWQFKLFQDITTQGPAESFYTGDQLEVEKVKTLSRTYAQAVAGTPIKMQFVPESSVFQLIYQVNTTITAPTEIFLNEAFYYPNGFTITILPKTAATWTKVSRNYITVTTSSTATQGQQIQVVITAQ